MHREVMEFCRRKLNEAAALVPGRNLRVLDVGSFDMNGSTRELFPPGTTYIGLDVHPGKGVDWVGPAHEFPEKGWDGRPFDVLISTECLEHDRHWRETLANCCRVLRPGGLFVMTCASGNRPPHYTECWPDGYYKNLLAADVVPVLEEAGMMAIRAAQVRNGLDLQVVAYRRHDAEMAPDPNRPRPDCEPLDGQEAIALVRRAVTVAGSTGRRRRRWGAVAEVFAVGSTKAARLCRDAGLDPHGYTGQGEDPAEEEVEP